MEAIVSLCAIIALALLALRLGTRGPATLAASNSMSGRATVPAARERPEQWRQPLPGSVGQIGANATAPIVTRILWPAATGGTYPLLQAIDCARAPGRVLFALDRDAAFLEIRARAWADVHWSEMAWLSGHIRQDCFDAICAEVERERQARSVAVQAPTILELADRRHREARWTSVAG